MCMDRDLPYQLGFALIGLLIIGPIFFAPIILGIKRGKRIWLIAFVNIFLGWTLVGYGLAMALALDNRR